MIDNLDPTTQAGHFWKFLAMGPDGKLYFNIGAPGNIVMPTYMQAAILRVDPEQASLEHVAQGVRNSVGIDLHPKTKDLWFTNHGRDWMSDDMPNDDAAPGAAASGDATSAIRSAIRATCSTPEFGKNRSCTEFDAAGAKLGRAHRAARAALLHRQDVPRRIPGTTSSSPCTARGTARQAGLQRDARRCSTRRATPQAEPFLTGFLHDEKADPPMWGRPVDVLVMKDGSMLVSDDYNGIIYRVSYKK